jgi:hypothetical protein
MLLSMLSLKPVPAPAFIATLPALLALFPRVKTLLPHDQQTVYDFWGARLIATTGTLQSAHVAAMSAHATPVLVDQLEIQWGDEQRQFNAYLQAVAARKDPAQRAAGQRLIALFLLGNGTAQTKLGYEKEVEWGTHQVQLLQQPEVAADVALCGAESHLVDIGRITDEFAAALGLRPGSTREPSPTVRLRDALAEARATYSAAHGVFTWIVANESNPTGIARARAVLDLIDALVARNPAKIADKRPPPVPG